MKCFRVLIVCGWLILGALAVGAQDNEEIMIIIPPGLEVDGGELYLGQVAVIKGATPVTMEKLKQVYLGPAPRYAETTWLYQTNVKYALDRSGFAGKYLLEMPSKAKISRAAQFLTKEMLLAAVEAHISSIASPFWEEWRIEPGRIQERTIPKGQVEVLVDDGISSIKPGLLTFRLRVLVDGEVFTTLPLTFRLLVKAHVYVSAIGLKRNEVISESSFHRELQELVNGNEFLKPLAADKFRVTREIPVGRVLMDKDIQEAPAVVKGSKLRLLLYSQSIEVELLVLAEEDGWLGDQILVTNIGSNRRLKATVIGPGLVEVRLD